jgi:hypothetical protein
MDLDGFGWIWIDFDGFRWIWMTTTSVTIGLKRQRTLCLDTAPRFCYHLGAWLLFVMRSAGHLMHGARIGCFSEHVRFVTLLLLTCAPGLTATGNSSSTRRPAVAPHARWGLGVLERHAQDKHG